MAEEGFTGPPMKGPASPNAAKSPDEAIVGAGFTLLEAGLLGPAGVPSDYMQVQEARQPWQTVDWRERLYPPQAAPQDFSMQRYLTGEALPTPSAGGGVLGVPPLSVEEQDGAPSVTGVALLKVPDGTLTDLGSGDVSLNYESPINKGQPNGYASLDGATKLPLVQLPAHKDTHKSGGVDAFISADLLEAVVKRLRESAGPTVLTMGAVADGQFLKRISATVVGQTLVFGNDYQFAVASPRTTTTSTTFLDKVTLVTPALTGTYRLGWHGVVDNDGIAVGEFVLWNDTDAVNVGAIQAIQSRGADNMIPVGGFAEVVFSGAPKTFKIQFRTTLPVVAQGIQDALIELWRVS